MAIQIKGQTLVEMTENRDMTKRLKEWTSNSDEEFKKEVWEYCKKLARYVHAPVSLAEYKRMVPFAANTPLVAAVFGVLQNCEVPLVYIPGRFDAVGYFYSIALISVAGENRSAHIEFLMGLAQKFISENHQFASTLHRNMVQLGKEYPDLLPIKEVLANHIEQA